MRDWILEHFQLEAVVSLPQFAFQHYDAGVKASILFMRKLGKNELVKSDAPIFMAMAENIGYDTTGRKTFGVKVEREKPGLEKVERHSCDLFDYRVEYEWSTTNPKKPVWREKHRQVIPGTGLLGQWAKFKNKPVSFFSLTPLERAKAKAFGVRVSELSGRIDVNFWRLTPLLTLRLGESKYPLTRLGDLAIQVQYGCSKLAKPEPVGTRMLRMNNLQINGWDLTDLKFVELDEDEFQKYKLLNGDLLFNRTNSKELVGKCEVFNEQGDWVFASYLIRLRLYKKKAIPHFVSTFLETELGRLQIDRYSRQIIGMTNINAEEIRDILVPLPPLDIQRRLVKEIRNRQKKAQRFRAKAEDEQTRAKENFEKGLLGE